MTDEQTATANSDVAAEQPAKETASPTQDTVAVPTEAQAVTPQAAPEPEIPTAAVTQALPEEPRFVIGAMFFLWVFCTLVFLSITAGYVAAQ
ncbi:hypothetical protein [Acaryochloris sp. IP29b_bin.148]|uniref:hypothetical protein n=1 Tax=Acaryochloris sp. IP29b_bin.148 TaxID=2969218 RepID=UPI0026393319|nr:hypothetical protein [Acaryochloris sp. IP29b_bin.148]